jgi:pyruvate kinase
MPRHTKIIATIGPATESGAMLDALIAAGTDIVRLNFSHGSQESHAAAYARVRDAAARAGRDVAVLQDLGGPKVRTGRLEGGRLDLHAGDALAIAPGEFAGRRGRIATNSERLVQAVRPGDRVLLADGLIELQVEAVDRGEIRTTVVEGGTLGERKGIAVPGLTWASALTDKDADDLRFGIALGVDLVAISFVQSADDLRRARQLAADAGSAEVPLVAKLERPVALEHLEEILGACEAVMVARGDLGLEMPLERVPRIQKEITVAARRHRVPVIVATQVLESMTVEPRPTRAEVSDAANAVADGVDGIMLAGETAVGAYPARAVQTLDAVIRDAEASPSASPAISFVGAAAGDHAQALCEAAVTLAERGAAQAIVAVTRGGNTARWLSALRPHVPIVATTARPETARRLALYRGVLPVCTNVMETAEGAGVLIVDELVARGLLRRGAPAVLVSINQDLARTDGNYVKIQQVG